MALADACHAWMGIDPGVSGAIAVIGEDPSDIEFIANKATERELLRFLRSWPCEFACLEKVSSSPQMGVKSAFTFGESFGLLRGLLVGADQPFETVLPRAWQKEIGCYVANRKASPMTPTQKKNLNKSKAEWLFPLIKVTHVNADALLLAEYARRVWCRRHPQPSGET